MGWSKKELLKSVLDFQKKNVFPPRLNLSVYRHFRYNSLRKLVSLYPNTQFNVLYIIDFGDASDFPKLNLKLDTLECVVLGSCSFSDNDKFEEVLDQFKKK